MPAAQRQMGEEDYDWKGVAKALGLDCGIGIAEAPHQIPDMRRACIPMKGNPIVHSILLPGQGKDQVPFIYILPLLLGINGIFFAQPISDMLATLLSLWLVRREKRSKDKATVDSSIK